MNTNIKDFLSVAEARQWAEYFAKECKCKIIYDYYFDNQIGMTFETVKEGRRINYGFMQGYKLGLTPHCKKNIEACVKDEHELRFYLKQKGKSFIYVVKYAPVVEAPPQIYYRQMELNDYAIL